MENNIAYIIEKINSISGQAPVKKTLQKMVYLLEEKGVDLGCEYVLHFYGPYCASLDSETARLSSEGIIDFDYSGYGHKMKVNQDADVEPLLTEQQVKLVDEVIERYKNKSPSDLELLTTAILCV